MMKLDRMYSATIVGSLLDEFERFRARINMACWTDLIFRYEVTLLLRIRWNGSACVDVVSKCVSGGPIVGGIYSASFSSFMSAEVVL